MKHLILAMILTLPLGAHAIVQCSNSIYNFTITRTGGYHTITGERNGIYTGHCQALISERNGHHLLNGVDPNAYYRNQCYADIQLGVRYGSVVSVPSDQTHGAIKEDMLLCTGEF